MDGFRDICRHIKRYAACDSLRKIIRNFLHFGFHFFATSMAFSPGSMNMLSTAAEPPLMPLSVA